MTSRKDKEFVVYIVMGCQGDYDWLTWRGTGHSLNYLAEQAITHVEITHHTYVYVYV